MLKLGIFGDSFADDNLNNHVNYHRGKSYIDYIRETNKFEVTNYASAGTSLYYSKKLFDEYYDQYDIIIFVVTLPNRLTVKTPKEIKYYTGLRAYMEKIQADSNPEIDEYDKNLSNAIDQYYIHLQDDEYDNTIQQIMLEDINSKFRNIIFIPAFENSIPGSSNYFNLWQINLKEINYLNIDLYPACEYDNRRCHMCEENHLILGQKLIDHLNGNPLDLKIEDFTVPSKDKSYYFSVPNNIWKFR